MTTDVSRRACRRRSGTRRDVLVDQDVKVVAHLLPVHGGGVAQHFYRHDSIDEAVTSQRAQLPLTDLLTHNPNRSTGCYRL
jgi:hypothetical protein